LKKAVKGIVYLLIWIGIQQIVEKFFFDSEARKAYGFLSAWWAALYISRVLEIKIKDFVYLFIGSVVYIFYIYINAHGNLVVDFFQILISSAVFFSPFLMDLSIRFLEVKLKKDARPVL